MLLGPGYRSCDLSGGQLFLLRPPLPTFPPTHPKILSVLQYQLNVLALLASLFLVFSVMLLVLASNLQ